MQVEKFNKEMGMCTLSKSKGVACYTAACYILEASFLNELPNGGYIN
jgi:hypothetical protein